MTLINIQFGKPRKRLNVRIAKTFCLIPYWEKGLPCERFFGWLWLVGFVYW